MATHHTKDKGDLGVAMVICDLVRHDIGVYIPLSEHQPCDLIAVRSDGALSRVQVKYRKLTPQGTIGVRLSSCYSDSNGYHERPIDRVQIDCFAVYCPDNGGIYYVRIDEILCNAGRFSLRIRPPGNNQKKGILNAKDFAWLHRIFDVPP